MSKESTFPREGGTDATPLLAFRNASRIFHLKGTAFRKEADLVAVSDVSLSLDRGETLGLVGESGCGKSTLGRLACGLLLPSSGHVLFEGCDVPPAGPASPVAGRLQMVFQDPFSSLNPRMRVGDAVAEGLLATATRKRLEAQGLSCDVHALAEEAFEAVGLKGLGSRYPHEFSGGQRQRIALARALVTHPDLVVADEPVSALDASVQAQVLNVMRDVGERYGMAFLFISHDLSVVGFMCARTAVMYLGNVVEELPREELARGGAHPYTQALFAAMPDRSRLGTPPRALSGEIPSPLDMPRGCPFHPRCDRCQPLCREVFPEWKELGPGWRVRCHLA